MKEITIDIDANGNVTIEGSGFVGTECTQLTKEIEAALGEVTKRDLKPEHRQTQVMLRKARA